MVTSTVGLDGVCAPAMGLIVPSDRAIQMAVCNFFILSLSSMNASSARPSFLFNGTKGNRLVSAHRSGCTTLSRIAPDDGKPEASYLLPLNLTTRVTKVRRVSPTSPVTSQHPSVPED